MTLPSLRAGLAALAALGGLAAAAHAQPPAAPAPAPQTPKVIQWPGGYLVMNGSEVIVRNSTPGRSTSVLSGVGNGFGNKLVVDNGPGGGLTVVKNARNGIGNQLILNPDDLVLDLDVLVPGLKLPALKPVAPVAAAPGYKGKATPFWTKKAFSDAHDCNLYWDPATKLWFRYTAEDDTYRPAPAQPAAPPDEK